MPDTTMLATTALEETWGEGPLLFLGEWCRRYERRSVWGARAHRVVPYHWDDRAKLARDHERLKEIHERLIGALAAALNRRHGLERPVRYWRMQLDPWLVNYVSIVWDRWECVRAALSAEGRLRTLAYEAPGPPLPPLDYAHALRLVFTDAWNHRLCAEILESAGSGRVDVERLASAGPPDPPPAAGNRRFSPFDLVDRLLSLLPGAPAAVLYKSFFAKSALVRLSLALRQTPRWHRSEFRWPVELADDGGPSRASLELGPAPADDFEKFLFRRLPYDLPSVHWEKFVALRARAERVRSRPRVILTANAHWGDEVFKVWAAERVFAGARYVTMSHGGGLPLKFNAMSFEEDVADAKTVWGVPRHPKHVRLPSNKLVTRRVASSRELLAVLGGEMPRYQYRAQSAPMAGQQLAEYELVCAFHDALAPAVRAAFAVRPYADQGICWNTSARYTDRLGAERVSASGSYESFLARARLIVCTYPETTLSEAMASGLPVILVYPAGLWETAPEMDSLLAQWREAKIAFDDPRAAAAHVEAVWDDVEGWWESPAVRRAREEFFSKALDLSADWLPRWRKFIDDEAGRTV